MILILDVFQHIKHKQNVECSLKLGRSVVNIVAIHLSLPGHVPAQRGFVQIETRWRYSIRIFDLPLQDTIAATDFSNSRAGLKSLAGKFVKHFKSPSAPEMIRSCQVEVLVRHNPGERLGFKDDPRNHS
jgi:hypothetical protein